jgi:hypothetical protein
VVASDRGREVPVISELVRTLFANAEELGDLNQTC